MLIVRKLTQGLMISHPFSSDSVSAFGIIGRGCMLPQTQTFLMEQRSSVEVWQSKYFFLKEKVFFEYKKNIRQFQNTRSSHTLQGTAYSKISTVYEQHTTINKHILWSHYK